MQKPSKPTVSNSDTTSDISDNNDTSDNESQQDKTETEVNKTDKTETEVNKNLQNIPVPGTENWSDNPDAYILSVSNESIGDFRYYGWYVTSSILTAYEKMTESQRKQFLKYLFEDEQVNYLAFNVDSRFYFQSEETGFDINTFKEQKCMGNGGFLDECIKRNIPMFVTISSVPRWMRAEKPYWLQQKYYATFAQMIANMVYDLRIDCGLNIVNVALGDEPDGLSGNSDSRNLAHYHEVLPLVTKYLKLNGMGDVGIIGAETCVIGTKWLNTLRSNENSWNNLFAYSGHDFGVGNVDEKLFNASRVTNKPLFLTSCGILNEHTVAGSFLSVNKNNEETIADYYTAMRNISPLLNNINMGANEISMWAPLTEIPDITRLDGTAPNFYHIFYNEDGKVFKNNFATSATYDYYRQALNTVKPGAKIYQCSTDKEGTMGGSFEKYTMNANAGINPDGTWGINIFNKTDSTVATPYKDMDYATKPQFERTITINFDIKGLYGTGAKDFKVYSTNTSGSSSEEIGVITLVDGRGTIDVFSLELLSLRSVESIQLNYKPMAIKQVVKNLNIAYIDHKYMLTSGKKKSFVNAPQMVYYNDYAQCGIKFNIKDFASLIGAEVDISSNEITVFNESGFMTFTVGDTFAKYNGNSTGTLILPEKVYSTNGEYYFELPDSTASMIGDIFNISYSQYVNTGLVVVGKTDVVNLGRFSQLFK